MGELAANKVVHLAEGNKDKYAKQRVDALDKDYFICKYTVFEEDYMLDTLGSIVYEIKFEYYGSGVSVCKTWTEFHTKVDGDQENIEELEEFKNSVDQAMGLFKIVEAYLLANPSLYA